MRKTIWCLAAFFTLSGLSGCSTDTVNARVTVGYVNYLNMLSTQAARGYISCEEGHGVVKSGGVVELYNEDDKQIATAKLVPSDFDPIEMDMDINTCLFDAEFTDAPGSEEVYYAKIAGVESNRLPRDEIEIKRLVISALE